MDVTVLELHLPEAQFETPFTGRSRAEHEESGAGSDEESDGGRMSGLAALAVLVGLAALAWYLRSGRGGGGGVETEGAMPERPA